MRALKTVDSRQHFLQEKAKGFFLGFIGCSRDNENLQVSGWH
jgi:hypothetical protein